MTWRAMTFGVNRGTTSACLHSIPSRILGQTEHQRDTRHHCVAGLCLVTSRQTEAERGADMETVTLPEQYSKRIETIAGYPIRITSYRLWDTFYAKAEVALDGMGGWFTTAEGSTQAGAEANLIANAERLLTRYR